MNSTRRDFIKLSSAASVGLALSSSSARGTSVPAKNPNPFTGTASEPRPSLPTVNEEIRTAAATVPLSMLFEGKTPGQLVSWQSQFSQKLLELIGPNVPPAKWMAKTLATATFADFTREELLLTSDGTPSLPLYIVRPLSTGRKKFPVVLCLHGHGKGGHDLVVGRDDTPELAAEIRKYNYDYGRQLVRQGYMVVAPCFTPFGRRLDESQRTARTDPCAMTLVRLMALGRTSIGENLRDARWALDYAAARPDARADRIGCVGFSYGGRMTTVVAALDARIRVAVISGNLNVYQERVTQNAFCGSQVIPRILEYGDIPEIGSLIAPRPVIWETGSDDPLIDPVWKEIAKMRMQRAYAAAGKPEALEFYTFKGGHSWNGTTAVALLAKELAKDI